MYRQRLITKGWGVGFQFWVEFCRQQCWKDCCGRVNWIMIKKGHTEISQPIAVKGLAHQTSMRYEHELKVTTSTIQYNEGPWYSTVQVQCIIILFNLTQHIHFKKK